MTRPTYSQAILENRCAYCGAPLSDPSKDFFCSDSCGIIYRRDQDERAAARVVRATCGPDVARFIDPDGTLQRAGLLTVRP